MLNSSMYYFNTLVLVNKKKGFPLIIDLLGLFSFFFFVDVVTVKHLSRCSFFVMLIFSPLPSGVLC